MFLPPEPDRLFTALMATERWEVHVVFAKAHDYLEALRLMDPAERRMVTMLFLHACPCEPWKDAHVNLDYFRRLCGCPAEEVVRTLAGIKSLGFTCRVGRVREDDGPVDDEGECVVVEFKVDRPGDAEELFEEVEDGVFTHTAVARAMVETATEYRCRQCAVEFLAAGDFSHLSSHTLDRGRHLEEGLRDGDHSQVGRRR